ncbi:MAG: hypothetical protein H0V81_16295 [Solirubrobacterales bacterium]|nr:hypothetical protein [Solirubrobacterales bacterium]
MTASFVRRLDARGALHTGIGIATISVVLAGMGIAESRADPTPEARTVRTVGALGISNSRADRAVLEGRMMLPGDKVGGSVTITNSGAAAGLFELSANGLADVPGRGGGVLSHELRLLVEAVGDGGSTVLYDGRLDALDVVPVGELGPGTDRTFRFTVTRPASGTPGEYRAATAEIDFVWTAVREEVGRCVNRILGSARADVLSGSREGDEIDGGAGTDTITGGPGEDCLTGESGDDVIDARDGVADTVDCGPGDDTVLADPEDTLVGCERRR